MKSAPFLILPLFALTLLAHSLQAAGPTGANPIAAAQAEHGFELRVPAPGPGVLADEILQKAIDTVAAQGGGVVLLGVGDFKLSRHEGREETVVLKSNVTLRGQGFATHLYFDPSTPANPVRYYPIRIGTSTVPAHNVVVEHLRYTGNDKAIGGGSIMGFNARLDEPESLLLSCDNVTVRNCWIYDAKQAVGCTKSATEMYLSKKVISPEEAKAAAAPEKVRTGYFDTNRMATQFKNWQVHHNYIETCGNKAVELAECNGGNISDNYIVNVEDGPQAIFGSRNVQIKDNVVYFTKTGINVSEGSHHIRVSGNHVEPMPDVPKGAPLPCLIFRTEPLPLQTRIHDVAVTGNIFRNQNTTTQCTLRFVTRPEALSCVYEGIVITGNVFDGAVQFFDPRTPERTTIRDLLFTDNVCEGDFLSVPFDKMASGDVVVRGNLLRKAGTVTLQASGWTWAGNKQANGTIEIAAGAQSNLVRDNETTEPIIDHGTETILTGNVVRKAARR